MSLIPFDSDREVTRDELVDGGHYRMCYSLDGGQTCEVRNVIARRRAWNGRVAMVVVWADDQFVEHAGFNPGVYIDSLVESARFECADRVQPISIDEINLCLAAVANTESELQ